MTAEFSPALILILGALGIPFLKGVMRVAYMLALPALTLVYILNLPSGEMGQAELFDLGLTTLRVDRLSLLFGYIFMVAAVLTVIYSIHLRDTVQHVAGLIYVGGALGAVFSGDTLFHGGPGATGRSFSDFPTILASIKDKLGALPADTVVYTGHGDSTTIGDEIVNYDDWVARGH